MSGGRVAAARSLVVSEAAFTDAVISAAHLAGWMVYHARPAWTVKGYRTAMQGDAGFPDLVFAKDGRVILAELKTERGELTDGQVRWARAIEGERMGPPLRWHLWRPRHWPLIRTVLGLPPESDLP